LKDVGGYNRGLMLKKIRISMALGLLIFSWVVLIWAILPVKTLEATQILFPSEMQLPSAGQEKPQSVQESRQVVLRWPSTLRIGDVYKVTLVFEPMQKETGSPTNTDEFSNIYDEYNLMADARLEAAGISAFPGNRVRESMPPGQPVKFEWQVSSEYTGSYQGNVWLSLRYLPLDGSQASQAPIYVHEVNIRTVNLLGMRGATARILGGAGIILSAALVFNDMIHRLQKKKLTIIDPKDKNTVS
jgi:hypothetical protein